MMNASEAVVAKRVGAAARALEFVSGLREVAFAAVEDHSWSQLTTAELSMVATTSELAAICEPSYTTI